MSAQFHVAYRGFNVRVVTLLRTASFRASTLGQKELSAMSTSFDYWQMALVPHLRRAVELWPFVSVSVLVANRILRDYLVSCRSAVFIFFVGCLSPAHYRHRSMFHAFLALALAVNVVSAVATYPHTLSYFNELAGGSANGARHLLDANIDWGQDLLYLREWCDAHRDARPFHLAWFGPVSPKIAGIEFRPVPRVDELARSGLSVSRSTSGGASRWYAISINHLYGYRHFEGSTDDYSYLRLIQPVAFSGRSIVIFEVASVEVRR